MRRRALSLGLLACALTGCWADDTRVDGFTADQFASLQKQYTVQPPRSRCPGAMSPGEASLCDVGGPLGQRLFFEPALSSTGNVSCVTCHDPRAWYADIRGTPVSMGVTKPTAHNTISVVNLVYKDTFTWAGQCQDRACTSPERVITDIAFPKAMGASPARVAETIRNNPEYASLYTSAFGALADDVTMFGNAATVLHAYLRQLRSVDAPFDAYIRGNASALSDSARRGFALFVGKAMCAECHQGAMFTDSKVHVTGVAQRGALAPAIDPGAPGAGGFFTPPLRHIEKTGPYMHDGSLATLADVIEFYRRGGDASGFTGVKDPLIQRLDISDDEARDLEAFLRSLTGAPIPEPLARDIRSAASCSSGTTVCGASCVDLTSDPSNCSACGLSCGPGYACVSSSCTGCPPPTLSCGAACVDVSSDATNCGDCGTICPPNKPTCSGGVCVH